MSSVNDSGMLSIGRIVLKGTDNATRAFYKSPLRGFFNNKGVFHQIEMMISDGDSLIVVEPVLKSRSMVYLSNFTLSSVWQDLLVEDSYILEKV